MPCFTQENEVVYWNNVEGLLKNVGVAEYEPKGWRLLLIAWNEVWNLHFCIMVTLGSIPVGHSTIFKEKCNEIKFVLEKIHAMDASGSFVSLCKVEKVGFLLGLQGGYTKFSYFLCIWDRDSRARFQHWIKILACKRRNGIGVKDIQTHCLAEYLKSFYLPFTSSLASWNNL